MIRIRILAVLFLVGFLAAVPMRAQLGKTIIVSAGSEVDHQLNEINAATDPAAKLKLIDAFSAPRIPRATCKFSPTSSM